MPISGIDIWNQATLATEQDYCYCIHLGCNMGMHNMFSQNLTTINLLPSLLSQVWKVVILNTWCITRKFLSDEIHYTVRGWQHIVKKVYQVPNFIHSCQHTLTQQPVLHVLKITTNIASDLTLFRTPYRLLTTQTNSNSMKWSTIEQILKLLHKR
jgi:hypothetical protein